MSKSVDTTHRHLVFTMLDFLWPFLKNRELLSIPFDAVSETLNS